MNGDGSDADALGSASRLSSMGPLPSMAFEPTTRTELHAEERILAAVEAFAHQASEPGTRPEALHDMIVAMHGVCGALTHAISVGVPDARIHELTARARTTASLSPFVARLQSWPRGYPGDFETIEYLLKQEVKASPQTAAYWIELHSLTSGIVQQHRNKVTAQAQRIMKTVQATGHAPTRVLVLAAGSSPDVDLALPLLERVDTSITLVDSDPEAIAFSTARLRRLGAKLTTVAENVLKVATSLHAQPPFDLILAGGLFDYLPTRHAKALLRTVFEQLLAPGGHFFFTNMAEPNPYRGWMRHVANWRVIERSADDIRALLEPVNQYCIETDMARDGTGLALLIDCTKSS
jgi:extracellular factor (EF) 3-hydroxypalmitic acid methyl ester biosynthesis protein